MNTSNQTKKDYQAEINKERDAKRAELLARKPKGMSLPDYANMLMDRGPGSNISFEGDGSLPPYSLIAFLEENPDFISNLLKKQSKS